MIHQLQYPPRPVRNVQHYARLISIFKNWPQFLAFKWGWKKGSLPLETRQGLKLIVPREAVFEFKEIFLRRAYTFPQLLRQIPPAPVVLDIGANVGFFSLFALHCRPQATCLSFEPLTANYQSLLQQRQLNAQLNWQIFHEAVMGHDGEVQIGSQLNGCDASATILSGTPSTHFHHTECVQARSLSTIFERERIPLCHWLKLDCEGSEYEILYQCSAALWNRIQVVSLEYHQAQGDRQNRDALTRFLITQGFQVYQADDAVLHGIRC